MNRKKIIKGCLVLFLGLILCCFSTFILLYLTNFWGVKTNIDLVQHGEELTRGSKTLDNGYTVSVGESIEYKNSDKKYLLYTTPRGVSSTELAYKNFKVDNNDFIIIRYRGPGGGSNGILSAYNYLVYKLEDKPLLLKLNNRQGFSSCHDVILEKDTLSYYLPYGKAQNDIPGGGCYGSIRGLGSKEYGEKISVDLSEIKNEDLLELEVISGEFKEYTYPQSEFGNKCVSDGYNLNTEFGEIKILNGNSCEYAKEVTLYGVSGLTYTNQKTGFYILGRE